MFLTDPRFAFREAGLKEEMQILKVDGTDVTKMEWDDLGAIVTEKILIFKYRHLT